MAAPVRAVSTAVALLLAMLTAACGTRADGSASTWPATVPSATGPTAAGPVAAVPSAAGPRPDNPAATAAAPGGADAPTGADAPADASGIDFPRQGDGKWRTAGAQESPADRPGRLLRYRVRVERDIEGVSVEDVADSVTRSLDDPRGWTAGGTLNLRRVAPGEPVDFTVSLATPGTRDRLCGERTSGYTSCRNGDQVVLNVARWADGVPGHGGGLAAYRAYMVNHEVGHRLGRGHELCPGPGRPAPVMQQQTLGLHGCVANSWPYLDGRKYAGAPGTYDDVAPAQNG
jgi:hypothetical protein